MSEPSIQQLQHQAGTLIQQGRLGGAMEILEQLIDREPADGNHWCALARVLARLQRDGDALACLLRGAELDPGSIACRTGLGHLMHERSRPEEAIHWHGEALALQPDSLLLHLNHLYVLPVIAESSDQIAHYRERILTGTDALLRRGGLRMRPEHDTIAHTFRLAYHGHNDRSLLRSYALLRERGLDQLFAGDSWRGRGSVAPRPATPRSRLRLGFVSANFDQHHSNTRAFEGLIRGLDRNRFELVLLPISDQPDAFKQQPLARSCTEVVALPEELPRAWQLVAGLNLDLLFYTDIGMHPFLHFLACKRLAPLQVCGWGFPQSSGYSSMDAYISSQLAEPADAQDHYSERCIQLPGLPCCYLSENLTSADSLSPFKRDYFFLPDSDTPLLGCLQHLQKLHPDFDAILEAIARSLPQAGFVLVSSREPELTERFLERIRGSAPTFHERLFLLQRMRHDEYLGLLRCLDLVLDPIHFGSGITMFETMLSGTPMICLEGRFLRSRIVAAAYRQMGIAGAPIATSAAEYVQLAVALIEQPDRRSALRQVIALRARAVLLDDLAPVRGFEAFVSGSVDRLHRAAQA